MDYKIGNIIAITKENCLKYPTVHGGKDLMSFMNGLDVDVLYGMIIGKLSTTIYQVAIFYDNSNSTKVANTFGKGTKRPSFEINLDSRLFTKIANNFPESIEQKDDYYAILEKLGIPDLENLIPIEERIDPEKLNEDEDSMTLEQKDVALIRYAMLYEYILKFISYYKKDIVEKEIVEPNEVSEEVPLDNPYLKKEMGFREHILVTEPTNYFIKEGHIGAATTNSELTAEDIKSFFVKSDSGSDYSPGFAKQLEEIKEAVIKKQSETKRRKG
jgi:hypothetical protein